MKIKANILNRVISTFLAAAITISFVGPSVGAIKTKEGVTQAASKKISELNDNFAKCYDKLKKIKNEINQANLKIKGKNQRAELILNNVIQEIENSIGFIHMIDCISLDDSVINIEIQNDLKDLSSDFRILEYFLGHCKLNHESNNLEYIEPNEIKQEQSDEILPSENSKLNKDLEDCGVMNVLLKYVFKVRDGLNNIKNKIKRVADNYDNNVTIKNENSSENDKDVKNKEFFNDIDKLYINANDSVEEKTAKIIDIIKEAFPQTDGGRERAMFAFDIINKYKDKGINREEIIKKLVEPIVREEMEHSFKRCCEEGGPLLSKKLYAANIKNSIDLSIKLAINTDAKSLYDFCYTAFYGTDVEYGFYDILNNDKKYWYDKYDRSKDCILCPVIIDIVELNSLVLRLKELEHVGINADNIRKISKVFDKIFNDADDEPFYHIGMYRHLTTKTYGEKECDEEYKELSVGDDTLLNELMDTFSGFVKDMSFNSNGESKADIEKNLHKHIDKIQSVIKRVDEKHSKLAEENPEFANLDQKNEFRKSRIDAYEHLLDLDLYKFAMSWDNLVFTIETNLMYNFRDNKIAFKENKLTIDEFVKRFEQDKRECIDDILYIKRFKDRFRYLNEFAVFVEYIGYEIALLSPQNSIIRSIVGYDHNCIMEYKDNATDQDLIEMKKTVDKSITDMKNIRANNFILQHEINYACFVNNYVKNPWDIDIYSGYNGPVTLANEFKKYYEENRYDLSGEKIEHLKTLATKFETALSQI